MTDLLPSTPPALLLRDEDSVALAMRDLNPGEQVLGVVVTEPIPTGHKLALRGMAQGEAVIKYASTIAVASQAIMPGQHVHVHNARMPDGLSHAAGGAVKQAALPVVATDRSFMGILRPNGKVATRNYVGILTTVNCSATVARAVADHFRMGGLARWPGVDGVIALTHTFGCAMAKDSEGITLLRRTLSGYAQHANFAGVLVIGLGCESNELSRLIAEAGGENDHLMAMDIQSMGGTRETIQAAIAKVEALLDRAGPCKRQPLPVAHLTLGLQCGGSDAFSGLTANPALGMAADLLVAHGGTAILSETPEIHGAEHLLLARAESPAVAEALNARMDWWTQHTASHGATLNDNPSAGNIAGGITTILEKSLGAVAKSGSAPLRGVYTYAQAIDRKGFVFMDSPGYDPVSATGQVASGANLIAFTTGRGSTFGCKPVPSIKLATNSVLFRRMPDDMDINCGDLIDGGVTLADKGREIFQALIATASGTLTASEQLNIGEAEFVPWVPGAIT